MRLANRWTYCLLATVILLVIAGYTLAVRVPACLDTLTALAEAIVTEDVALITNSEHLPLPPDWRDQENPYLLVSDTSMHVCRRDCMGKWISVDLERVLHKRGS